MRRGGMGSLPSASSSMEVMIDRMVCEQADVILKSCFSL